MGTDDAKTVRDGCRLGRANCKGECKEPPKKPRDG